MSAFHYAGPRRYPRSTSARTFPEVYYNERNVAHEYPRVDPYSHAVGAPVSRLPSRTRENHHEFQPEQGGARRRIAVAVRYSFSDLFLIHFTCNLPFHDSSQPLKFTGRY